ncbi:profilin [Volvox carteri f. nagariensis]|uniref:Profilin n=1 Tax=Volvox carteri f. nagariensis TaxID=3068 RepID=A1YQX7_VOLCA|nr:profilin [Volvox carteri f. nagariensis]ABM47309.1 profilin [Volvox carteri f. nagariensis]EFJ44887.1 profilin [Volvox carteri f. nagariensis]|eukprot:XP_002954170.1 profilin [Volvox carteri f. nagariensis]
MSWDEYITSNLMAPVDANGSTLSSAAILGLDGSVWAKSSGFPAFTPEEFEKVMAAMADPAITAAFFSGAKYMKVTSDETVLRCRKDKIGFIARKTNTAIVMGFYEDPPVSGQMCNRVVEALGDYLEHQGY